MDKQRRFEIHFGGIFAKPTAGGSEVNPSEARNAMVQLLMSDSNVVKKMWGSRGEQAESEKNDFSNIVAGVGLGDEGKIETYMWHYPLIFKIKVDKGFSLVDAEEAEMIIESSIEATVAYNGIWFMTLFDPNQFSKIDDLFFCAPNIREILVNLMRKGSLFVPQVIPPCVIPKPIYIQVGCAEEHQTIKFPHYIGCHEDKNTSRLIVRYEMKSSEVSDSDIVEIMQDIYFSVWSPLDSFYMMSALSHWQNAQRMAVVETYEETCRKLRAYLEIPAWNILKRTLLANELGRDVSNIQIQLVENRLWQARITRQSNDIDSYEDRRGIIGHMRGYLKNCITEPFAQSSEEYEGFISTLSHIGRISSQHSAIMMGIVAIIAALIGAIIGFIID